MEDSGDESEDGDSSDNRVPASGKRGEEQCGTNTKRSGFSSNSNLIGILKGHGSESMLTLTGDLLVMN
jgi:hypothetical protein